MCLLDIACGDSGAHCVFKRRMHTRKTYKNFMYLTLIPWGYFDAPDIHFTHKASMLKNKGLLSIISS